MNVRMTHTRASIAFAGFALLFSATAAQAQSDDPALTARARGYADRLGLAFERRFTGYGDLQTTLQDVADNSV